MSGCRPQTMNPEIYHQTIRLHTQMCCECRHLLKFETKGNVLGGQGFSGSIGVFFIISVATNCHETGL